MSTIQELKAKIDALKTRAYALKTKKAQDRAWDAIDALEHSYYVLVFKKLRQRRDSY